MMFVMVAIAVAIRFPQPGRESTGPTGMAR